MRENDGTMDLYYNRSYILLNIHPGINIVQTIEILVSIISLYVAFKGMFIRRGFNRQVKKLIFTRQVFFVLIRLVSIVISLLHSAIALKFDEANDKERWFYTFLETRNITIYTQSIKVIFYFIYLYLDPNFR